MQLAATSSDKLTTSQLSGEDFRALFAATVDAHSPGSILISGFLAQLTGKISVMDDAGVEKLALALEVLAERCKPNHSLLLEMAGPVSEARVAVAEYAKVYKKRDIPELFRDFYRRLAAQA